MRAALQVSTFAFSPLTLFVFLLIASVTACFGRYFTADRGRAIRRLSGGREAVRTPWVPALLAAARDLVASVGSIAPAAPNQLLLVKRRLIRAGFRRPEHARYFYGARAIGA